MDDLKTRLERERRGAEPPPDAYERLLRYRDRRATRRRVTSGVLALVVATGAIVGAIVAFGGGNEGRRAPQLGSSGSSPTDEKPPAAGPSLDAAPGQYYYWRSEQAYTSELGDVVYTTRVTTEAWLGPDGSGRLVVEQAPPEFRSEADRRTYEDAYGSVPEADRSDHSFGPGKFPGDDLSSLSTDPAELRDQLLERSSDTGASPQPEVTLNPDIDLDSSQLWRAATSLLRMPSASPRLRIALHDVLASIADAEEGQGEVDPGGRPSATLTLPFGGYYGGVAQTLFFDPETHLLTGATGGQDGVITVEESGLVDSRTTTPGPGERYFPSA
jgi:hypothetical protein